MAEIIRSVADRSDFGFTAGASGASIMAIMETNDLIYQTLERREPDENFATRIQHITEQLDCMELEHESSPHIRAQTAVASQLHLKIFHLGGLTYLNRSVTDYPPKKLSQIIRSAFEFITGFQSQGGRNLALWPLFMVAVEVYDKEHMVIVRNWLHHTAMLGMGNRTGVQQLLEEVWRRREQTAAEKGLDPGEVIVDWRDVMSELGFEILLI